MSSTRLSSKGQIILPKALRDERHWKPGTEFAIIGTADGVLLKPLKPFPPTKLRDVIGCAGYRGPARSIEEMDDAIRKGARRSR